MGCFIKSVTNDYYYLIDVPVYRGGDGDKDAEASWLVTDIWI